MPQTEILFFREPKRDAIPLLDWLARIPAKARIKCIERIDRLAELGHELRRPEADLLRDGIHELRASYQGVHYRILYFFAGQFIVVLSHGLTKEKAVPPLEIDRARERKKAVLADLEEYTFKPE